MNYPDFIASKRLVVRPAGIDDPPDLSPKLFPFQRDIVKWALRRGRAAIWADCGLGKGWMALEWARVIAAHTGLPVIILAPLAVAQQFAREGAKLGVAVTICRSKYDVRPGVNVANYERLHLFDLAAFGGVVLDESSCLKDFTSMTRNALIEGFASTPFRLACTATPAPNDHMELGNHAEFLGAMTRTEMLAMFFVHDGGDTSQWRLKGHARKDYWRWLCSWAVSIRRPSDLGYDDGSFALPPLVIHEKMVPVGAAFAKEAGALFITDANGIQAQRGARRSSLDARVAAAADIVAREPNEQWLVWCDLNQESESLTAAIPGAVEVRGSDDPEKKLAASEWFAGYRCLCDSPLFAAKLPEWEALRARSISRSTTEKTASGDLPPHASISDPTPKKRKPTSRSTTESTERNTKEPRSNKTPSTPEEESVMLPIPTSGQHSSSLPQTSGETTLVLGLPKDSGPTDSQSKNMSESLPNKAADAQSVGESRTSIPSSAAPTDSDGFTSTTATKQEKFEASFVRRATSGLESSKTTPSGLSARRCICGHESGVRRLVSKPSIFGWGVNFQSCHSVVFVGLSNSFEQWYQAVRRTWRFGQTREVHCHIVISDADGAVRANLERKRNDAETMANEMLVGMGDIQRASVRALERDNDDYAPVLPMVVPAWLKTEESAA